MNCRGCGTDNRPGRRFCTQCGEALALELRCQACGAVLEAEDHFCGRCGAAAADGGASSASVSERRLVTVMFADLATRWLERIDSAREVAP